MTPLDLLLPEGTSSPHPIIGPDVEYTFDDLMSRAGGVASSLSASRGVRRGGHCIVSLPKGADFFAGLVGCWMAGQVPVLLDPMVRTELKEAVAVTGASAAVLSEDKKNVPVEGVAVSVPDGTLGAPLPIADVSPEETVLYLFTSGSTGRPTLVPKRFDQIAVEVAFISELFERPKRVAGLIPWCHIWGLLSSFFVPLKMGGVCDLRGGISARGVLTLVRESELDFVAAVPVYYQAMVKLMAAGVISLSGRECRFASSSAPLLPALRNAFFALSGCGITDIYGSTEAGGIAYRHDDGPWIPEPHVAIRVDRDGLLSVKSPSVSFETPDGFFETGDLVREQENGFVLLGRGDDVVKIGGRRIALGEINARISSMAGVRRSAVLTERVADTNRLAAYVQSDDPTLTAADVKIYVRDRLADHKVPRVVRFVEEIPMTSSGKLDKQKLLFTIGDKVNS